MKEIELVKILWNYLYMKQKIEKADCILGLGCYDLDIPKRCAELYKQGYSDIIIFSGGLGRNTQRIWSKAEADKFAEIAIDLGVPENKIYIENESTNSAENFTFTNKLITENQLKVDIFLLVHKPYMERRAMATFYVCNPDKKCYITSSNITFEEHCNKIKTQGISQEELINTIVGDIQRMKIYAEKGWQIKQDIPCVIWEAYENLVEMGYNKDVT